MKDIVLKGTLKKKKSLPNIKSNSVPSTIITLLLCKPRIFLLENLVYIMYSSSYLKHGCNFIEAHVEILKSLSQHM